jgi:type IV secretory pathway VirB6-like protein
MMLLETLMNMMCRSLIRWHFLGLGGLGTRVNRKRLTPVFGHGLRPDASAFVTISIFLRFLFKPVNRLSRPSLSVLIHQNRQLINMLTLRDYTMKNLIAALVAGLFAVSAFAAGHSAAPAAPAKAAAPAASATPATPATSAAASADAPKAKKEKKEKKEKKAKKTKEAKADAAPASK